MTALHTTFSSPERIVQITSPARLHLGFLDLNGNIGRRYGSLGLAIDAFKMQLEVSFASQQHIDDAYHPQKTAALVKLFFQTLGQQIPESRRNIHVAIKQAIPQHAGFGSGTQLALCLGTALCKLYHIEASTQEIARHLNRGHRSGVGIHTFDYGGFVVDGGSGPQTLTPPLLAQVEFPPSWRIILVMDNEHQGAHGEYESAAFKNLAAFPQRDAHTICHLTLMKLLPALLERDCDRFGEAVTTIQSLLGQHFAPAQGGRPYTSDAVARTLSLAASLGCKGIAQSSWGPTGCLFVDSETKARHIQAELAQFASQQKYHQISLTISRASQQGAKIAIRTH